MKKLALLVLVLICSTSYASAQSPAECLEKVKLMEPKVPDMFNAASASLKSIMPDPVAYEKTLPPFAQVIADKDKINLKNYGGLAEAYYYSGDATNGKRVYDLFSPKADSMLDPTDTFKAGVCGDIGMLYFNKKEYTKAKPLLLDATKRLEAHLTAANANNLVSDYMCLTLISDKEHKTPDAQNYAKKLFELVIKQKSNKL